MSTQILYLHPVNKKMFKVSDKVYNNDECFRILLLELLRKKTLSNISLKEENSRLTKICDILSVFQPAVRRIFQEFKNYLFTGKCIPL